MKFGACFNFLAEGKDSVGLPLIKKFADYGYDYLELPLSVVAALSDEEFEKLKSDLKEAGITCEACNGFLPASERVTGDAVDEVSVLNYVEGAFKRANELGVEYVVFGSPGAKSVPEGFSLEAGCKQVVEFCKKFDPIAKKNDIVIVIEPLNKGECNIINTFEEGCQIAQEVNCSNIKVLVDYYHLMLEKEPLKHLERWGKDYLRHVHFAKVEGRRFPERMDEDPGYQPFIEVLKRIGYDDRISIEGFSENLDEDGPKTLAFFQQNFL